MSRRARLGVAIAAICVLNEREKQREIAVEEQRKNRKRRRVWVREWIDRRSDRGFGATLFEEIREGDRESYKNCMRMPEEDFNVLLEMVKPFIQKQDTVMRKSISAKERLCLTLRYLASGKQIKKN